MLNGNEHLKLLVKNILHNEIQTRKKPLIFQHKYYILLNHKWLKTHSGQDMATKTTKDPLQQHKYSEILL